MTANMKPLVSLCACLLLFGTGLFSQKTVTWKGGTPGRETQWQCPGNWSGYQVPDEFSDVTIPDVSTFGMAYPVVKSEVEINSLRLESNAMLTIAPEGRLTVLNEFFVLHPKNLKVNGDLHIMQEMQGINYCVVSLRINTPCLPQDTLNRLE